VSIIFDEKVPEEEEGKKEVLTHQKKA